VKVATAVRRELRALRARAPALADSALAASALVLAQQLDDPGNSATSKASCQRALRETLDRLRDLAPADGNMDPLDDLAARRAARLGRGSAP
jgi:hypothetical protein